MTYAQVVALALKLPGVEESSSYGTPALKARGKLLARLKEDGETLVLRTDFVARETLLSADPETFFITDHYRDYPMVLVRLQRVKRPVLAALLRDAHALVTARASGSPASRSRRPRAAASGRRPPRSGR